MKEEKPIPDLTRQASGTSGIWATLREPCTAPLFSEVDLATRFARISVVFQLGVASFRVLTSETESYNLHPCGSLLTGECFSLLAANRC